MKSAPDKYGKTTPNSYYEESRERNGSQSFSIVTTRSFSISGRLPRLCFIGPMIGCHPGRVGSQGEVLSALLEKSGYYVRKGSSVLNRYLRFADIIRTIIKGRNSTDILVLEIYGGPSFVVEDIASWLAKRLRMRVVMWLHGGALPEFMERFPRWASRVFKRADVLITPSNYLSRAVASYGFQGRVIPNTIDVHDYHYRKRTAVKPRLFWMRSFHSVWNPLMAIRVLAGLKKIEPDASLVMAGQDKGLYEDSFRLAGELGLASCVRFPGFLDTFGKVEEGNAADIFINTNRIDNMPVSVLEACAMGLPVITTAVGGMKDFLEDGQTGLLVPDDDDAAMIRAIKRLIDDPCLAERLSINGRHLAEQCSWKVVRQQWQALFSEIGEGGSLNN